MFVVPSSIPPASNNLLTTSLSPLVVVLTKLQLPALDLPALLAIARLSFTRNGIPSRGGRGMEGSQEARRESERIDSERASGFKEIRRLREGKREMRWRY
jgi:hypothetical protein